MEEFEESNGVLENEEYSEERNETKDIVDTTYELYERYEEAPLRQRHYIVKRGISLHPNTPLTYNLLARLRFDYRDYKEARRLYKVAMYRSIKNIEDNDEYFFKRNVKDLDTFEETKDYLRSLYGIALCTEKLCQLEEAVEKYREILSITKNDQFGIRGRLCHLLLRLKKLEEAEEVIHGVPLNTNLIYCKFLIEYIKGRRNNDLSNAQEYLKRAYQYNVYVPFYLIFPHFISTSFNTYDVKPNSKEEAFIYSLEFGIVWRTTSGALQWLKKRQKFYLWAIGFSTLVAILIIIILGIIALIVVFTSGVLDPDLSEKLSLIRLLPEFNITLYSQVPNARQMTLSPNGILFVGTVHSGKVFAITPDKKLHTVLSNLDAVHVGVAFHNGSLYVAAKERILRLDNIENNLSNPPTPVVVYDKVPHNDVHGQKYIKINNDKLYIPSGANCNVCYVKDPFATLSTLNLDGTNFQIIGRGIRNTVGYDWHPITNELYFTDNGRDYLGNDLPPDELNVAPVHGLHFGFPYCYGKGEVDKEFNKNESCSEYVPALYNLGPHVAALGMTFYRGDSFPVGYKNNVIFIAEHGSWNRDSKIGYRITMVNVSDPSPSSYKVFAEGWLQGEEYWGRPVDVLNLPDGSILVSDDYAGAVYRIVYNQ